MVNWIKVISIVLKAPLWLFIIASFGGSIYAAYYKIQNISWSTPLIMGSIIIVYLIGLFIDWKQKKNE